MRKGERSTLKRTSGTLLFTGKGKQRKGTKQTSALFWGSFADAVSQCREAEEKRREKSRMDEKTSQTYPRNDFLDEALGFRSGLTAPRQCHRPLGCARLQGSIALDLQESKDDVRQTSCDDVNSALASCSFRPSFIWIQFPEQDLLTVDYECIETCCFLLGNSRNVGARI